MNLLLFGGFLGSGKTTIVLQVARRIVDARKETVAIIENEIGEEGIDDQLFRGNGLQVKPLFGGCVCCQITSDLVSSISEIRKTVDPDWLIVEMTGLAIPGNVVDFVSKYSEGFTIKAITIVDGSRWTELFEVLEPLMIEQVKNSDLIIINKIDAADRNIADITKDISAISGKTSILSVNAVAGLPISVFEEVLNIE